MEPRLGDLGGMLIGYAEAADRDLLCGMWCKCPADFEVIRYIQSNGATQYRLRCTWCDRTGADIARRKLNSR